MYKKYLFLVLNKKKTAVSTMFCVFVYIFTPLLLAISFELYLSITFERNIVIDQDKMKGYFQVYKKLLSKPDFKQPQLKFNFF